MTDLTKAKALVLEKFHEPLVLREFDIPEPGPGEVLAKVTAAGICGSDIHELDGRDPRTPLPIIPGHEGVGEIIKIGDGAALADGSPLSVGMPVVWERSLTCGECYFCKRGERYLCTTRKVYGINISSADPPHLSGNYTTHILLRKATSIYKYNTSIDPSVLVAATCSGTTACHANDRASLKGGETVLIYGSGPVAAFQTAFAIESGAKWVVVVTREPGIKAEIISEFGADEVLFRSTMSPQEIVSYLLFQTCEIGVDVVFDTTADPNVFCEAVKILRRGGTYVNPGLAVPSEQIPLEMYSDVVNKNLTIHGVWAGDASHLQKSIALVEFGLKTGRYPFDRLVTHRFKLEDHSEAFRILSEKQGVKVVFEPWS